MHLTSEETYMASDAAPPAVSMAMRVVMETGRLMGASSLIPISHAHIDGCVYFSDAGVHFAEKLRDLGGKTAVPSSLNVGALDLVNPGLIRHSARGKDMAGRLMKAYTDMGCKPSWTCAPYQAGFRPAKGEQVAWAESNAIVFANSILGARTNRYGDFFDICAAITGRAPYVGLHLAENRLATVLVDLSHVPDALFAEETFYPVLGTWLGQTAGNSIAAFRGIPPGLPEDWLKAMAAATAAAGSVALFHIIGTTPEAATEDEAFGGRLPQQILRPSLQELQQVRMSLTSAADRKIDCVALGSPHFSLEECQTLAKLCAGKSFSKPVYVCTRHDVYAALTQTGERQLIEAAGGTFVIGTCVVVTPILRQTSGVLMTNSGKFAHYSKSTVNHDVIYGSLRECVAAAVTGVAEQDSTLWG